MHGIMPDPFAGTDLECIEPVVRVVRHDPYRDINAINWSTLKAIAKSPKHYQHATAKKRADRHHLLIGRAAHAAILEPDWFATWPVWEGTRRGKAWDLFKATHAGEDILTVTEQEQCLRMRRAVMEHPIAAAYLSGGEAEKIVTWTDADTGLRCKGRIDYVTRRAIVDVKTTGDVAESRFGSWAARIGYHGQAAFYRDGYAAAHGLELPFVIVAVEVEEPHDVAVYRLDEDALYAGQRDYARFLGIVKDCQRTGEWPGRYPEERTLTLPPWVIGDDEEDITDLDLVINGGGNE
jgi:exodeoxyribonuclease VIII